jgi:hypothetical protein
MFHKTRLVKHLTLMMTLAGTAATLAVTGCFHPAEDELTNGVVAGERPVAMEGSSAFFAGRVVAKVTLSRGIGKGLRKGRGDKDKAYQDYTDNRDKTLIGSPLPPVTLHLILTNTGGEPVTVEMIDFESDLGNFALDPDRLTIAPGATAEPTSMVSQLGVSSDVIPFKVTLRVGKAKESQTVQVRILHAEADAPPAR